MTEEVSNTGNELNTRQEETIKSFWPLVNYSLSVIVVCLTCFNFYLFCWLWSSLSGTQSGGWSLMKSNQWASMDLISSWDRIKFEGKLTNQHEFRVDQILQVEGEEKLDIFSKNLIQIINNVNKKALIEITPKRIQLPSGLRVQGTKEGKTKLTCSTKTAKCLVEAPKIQLSHQNGVNFNRKSIQTSKIRTKRLHSPTNWLNLLSTSSSLFESKVGSIQMSALDELTLFSHNSAVILNAETINVSKIKGFADLMLNRKLESSNKNSTNSTNKYKLCICLPEIQNTIEQQTLTKQQRNVSMEDEKKKFNSRIGLVFAIKPKLNCSKFTTKLCNIKLK